MAKVLCYTSPARGHLFPTVPILLELRRRGHDVALVAMAAELRDLAAAGLRARAIPATVEAIAFDDYRATSPTGAVDSAVRTLCARAVPEMADLESAIAAERPDVLLVDYNCWGAAALAEQSSLPWALFMPYFLPWRLPGLPPFGPGLAPRRDLLGRARDMVLGKLVHGVINRNLPKLNAVRARAGAPPLAHMSDMGRTAPRILYYTAEPFEYACPERPSSVVLIGPPIWEPPAPRPTWLDSLEKPIVLVTCSTEFQDDGRLVEAALAGLADEDVYVVATTAAVDPARFSPPANARVERFVPHAPLLERAAAVICHGGMGITQKALAAGVPVCVVPFGRDQLEVARHVEVAGAGVRLPPKKLTPARLHGALTATLARKAGAARLAEAFRAAGGAGAGADVLEALLPSRRGAV